MRAGLTRLRPCIIVCLWHPLSAPVPAHRRRRSAAGRNCRRPIGVLLSSATLDGPYPKNLNRNSARPPGLDVRRVGLRVLRHGQPDAFTAPASPPPSLRTHTALSDPYDAHGLRPGTPAVPSRRRHTRTPLGPRTEPRAHARAVRGLGSVGRTSAPSGGTLPPTLYASRPRARACGAGAGISLHCVSSRCAPRTVTDTF